MDRVGCSVPMQQQAQHGPHVRLSSARALDSARTRSFRSCRSSSIDCIFNDSSSFSRLR